jgi:hypothetical protein
MVEAGKVLTPTIFDRLTPPMALFIAHAIHTSGDAESRGLANGEFARIAVEDVKLGQVDNDNERGFRGEMFAVISSYARSMTRTKKAVQHDVADAEDQSDDFEEDRSSRRIQSALFGYVLKIAFAILGGVVGAIVAGFLKPYFPDDFGHKGATLSTIAITTAFGLFGLWLTMHLEDQKRRISRKDAKWQEKHSRLMHADERINQYQFHREQLCTIYKIYTGYDYSNQPDSFLLSMQSERQLLFDLSQRERRRAESDFRFMVRSVTELLQRRKQRPA